MSWIRICNTCKRTRSEMLHEEYHHDYSTDKDECDTCHNKRMKKQRAENYEKMRLMVGLPPII